MKIIRCDPSHAGAILAIFNEAIVNSTALYDYRPRTPAMMESWFEAKAKGRYPDRDGQRRGGTHGVRELRDLPGLAGLQIFGRALGLR